MTDLDRFEARLVSALARLADEAPVDVDAAQLASRITSAGHPPRWSRGYGAWRLVPALRLSVRATAQALLVVAAIAVLVGTVVLSQRIVPTPYEGALFGQITCSGEPWTSTSPQTVTLSCSTELQDDRLLGLARIEVGKPTASIGSERRRAAVELHAGGSTWIGDLALVVGRSGTAAGDAVLYGRGDAASLVTRLHVVSGDGLTWGVVGSMETTR